MNEYPEVVAWLVKKAREVRAVGTKQAGRQADVIGSMASQIQRGAVRPNNTLRLPATAKTEPDWSVLFLASVKSFRSSARADGGWAEQFAAHLLGAPRRPRLPHHRRRHPRPLPPEGGVMSSLLSDLRFRAIAHSRHLDAESRRLFELGYNAGRAAGADDNTARVLEQFISKSPAQAAGYIEGLAATRQEVAS